MPNILKSNGEIEAFDPAKLVASLMRSGAGEHTAERIADTISRTVTEGARSDEIYRRAFALLRKEARPAAARYSLRRAMLEIGPTGFPFEDFVSHLFKHEGWQVETRKIMQGKCVPHEVDVYATRPLAGSKTGEVETVAAELKYHNDPGYKTDVKIALYVKARFEDIWHCDPRERTCPVDRGVLITNTKFTSQAIQYAECAGLELVGWSYPLHDSLYERMYRARVYPVTSLTTLKVSEKKLFMQAGVIACDMLRPRRELFAEFHISPARVGEILAEAEALCSLPYAPDTMVPDPDSEAVRRTTEPIV
ncbi:MAG: ATP cone domain-containing protein [bacterium]